MIFGITLRPAYCCGCDRPIDPTEPRLSGKKGDANVSFCYPCIVGKVIAWEKGAVPPQEQERMEKWRARYERDVAEPVRRALARRRERGWELRDVIHELGMTVHVRGDETFFFELRPTEQETNGKPTLWVGRNVVPLVQEQASTPKGARVVKILAYKPFSLTYNRLIRVALAGSDEVGQPWMHAVWSLNNNRSMRGAARRSLEEAERWLLRMNKKDVLVDSG